MSEIPTCPNEVTKEWLNATLKEIFTVEKIEIVYFEKVQQTEGFTSGAFKARAKTSGNEINFFIKSITDHKDPSRYYMEEFYLDHVEILAYKEILPKLIEFEKSNRNGKSRLELTLPTFYGGNCCLESQNRGSYVIMEDLSLNFHTFQGEKGLSYEQTCSVLDQIAALHTISYAFLQKQPEAFSQLDIKSYHEKVFSDKLFENHLLQMPQTIKSITDMQPEFEKPLKNIAKKYKMVYQDVFFTGERRFIIHGDLWLNNIMFSPHKGCKIIDWQFCTQSHPSMDFALFLCSSVKHENMVEWLDQLVAHYLQKVTDICEEIKIDGPFSKEEFTKSTQKFGIMRAVFFLVLMAFENVSQFPGMADRALGALKLAIDWNPAYFSD